MKTTNTTKEMNVTVNDIENVKATIGWNAFDDICDGVECFEDMDVEEYLNDSEVKVVTFEEGMKEVIDYAKEYGGENDIERLEKKLVKFGKKYEGKKFFTFGIESDWNIGVV